VANQRKLLNWTAFYLDGGEIKTVEGTRPKRALEAIQKKRPIKVLYVVQSDYVPRGGAYDSANIEFRIRHAREAEATDPTARTWAMQEARDYAYEVRNKADESDPLWLCAKQVIDALDNLETEMPAELRARLKRQLGFDLKTLKELTRSADQGR
jgi:hypothetical protein